jgi:hypothetical protein
MRIGSADSAEQVVSTAVQDIQSAPGGLRASQISVGLSAQAVWPRSGIEASAADSEIRAPCLARADRNLEARAQLLDPVRSVRETTGIAAI